MHCLRSNVLFHLIVLSCFNFTHGFNSDIIKDIVRRLESVERSNAILRQNDMNLRRVIRHQQKDIHILQRTLKHNTKPVPVQNFVDQRKKEVDNLLHDNEVVDNFRQDNIVVDNLLQDEMLDSLLENEKVVDSLRQDKIVVDSLRHDIIKDKSAIELTHNASIKGDEGTTRRSNQPQTEPLSFSSPIVTTQEGITQREQVLRRMFRSAQVNSEYVAFLATIDRGRVSHLTSGQTIVFESVNLNLGYGYYSDEGIFITPKLGLYIFSVSILSYDIILTNLERNHQRVASVYCHGEDGGFADQGSVTVVMVLERDDEVYVKVDERTGSEEFTLYGDRYTSFTGILLWEL